MLSISKALNRGKLSLSTSFRHFGVALSSEASPPTTPFVPSIPNVSHLKRFYKKVTVVPHPDSDSLPKLKSSEDVTFENLSMSHGPYWAVALDGRVIKTMYKDPMPIPSRALAIALAEEWESQ